jgi:hypothetical protein
LSEINTPKIYGISQNPDTKDYIMVIEYSNCEGCGENFTHIRRKWCKPCQINNSERNFANWTSGNEEIDNFIQEIQLNILSQADRVVEWIPYDQFNNIIEVGKSGFAIVKSAVWKDGYIIKFYDNEFKRYPNKDVTLKCLSNSQYNFSKFLNEV